VDLTVAGSILGLMSSVRKIVAGSGIFENNEDFPRGPSQLT